MVNILSKYEFLTAVHGLMKPDTYLEIGVQTGASMACAQPPTFCIGVDPDWSNFQGGLQVSMEEFAMTSDDYFASVPPDLHVKVDLAFIDGLHLAEQALRDFYNCERVMSESGVIIIDDVLPYNQAIASRTQPPGDWTGDVWRVYEILSHDAELTLRLVNVSPTGLLVITGLRPGCELPPIQLAPPRPGDWEPTVPEHIINRDDAYAPGIALAFLSEELGLI